ncbi:GNAT family N-acetyltransferase [Chitinibacter sp. GC72]|uniref:GNAT family N-acetyltransferase n=1 Tax=Chitinibacter sp. GC72 TaxID=1526917 RepID=UPI0012FAAE2D|nr:GNAT family N-acetyltransferase [Chitinibacter sp. GC72]
MAQIEQLPDLAAIRPFLPLLGHAEFTLYDGNKPEHSRWLITKIDRLFYCGAQFFGAVGEQGEPIGIISVLIEPRPADLCGGWQSAEITQLAVAPERQKQGIGSQLLLQLEAALRGQQVYCVYLSTYPADFDVIAFYGKNGFMPTGIVPDVYGPGLEGKLYLRKVLANQ